MRRMTRLRLAPLGVALVLNSGTVLSDGFRNPPPTAAGVAKSGANLIFSEDSSAVFYNPANLAFLDQTDFSQSVILAHLEVTYISPSGQKLEAEDSWQPLPNLFAAYPLKETPFVLGMSVNTPYGQGVEWDRTDITALHPTGNAIYSAEMKLINFNPSVGMKIGDSLLLGAGLDIMYSELMFKQNYAAPFADRAKLDTDGTGVGVNFGLTWQITPKQRAALTYRSPVKIEYDGDVNFSNFASPIPGTSAESDASTEIKFPSIVGAGYGIELTEKLRVETSVEWLEWSLYKDLTIDSGRNNPLLSGTPAPATIPQNWKDTVTIAAGADYQLTENWILRCGYAFIETPIPNSTAASSLPDANRHVISLGAGYNHGNHAFDIGYAYSIYDHRKSYNGNDLVGKYELDSDLVGLSYRYRF